MLLYLGKFSDVAIFLYTEASRENGSVLA
jgi:hypothetical protein